MRAAVVAPVLGLVCFLGAPMVLPLVASASTVTVRETPSTLDEVRYVAAAGERNALQVRHDYDRASGSSWTFSDAGAIVSPGRSCTTIDEHTVKCVARGARHAKRPLIYATTRLGDLDDELHFAEAARDELPLRRPALPPPPALYEVLTAYGGDGNDQLFAGGEESLNSLEGGAGNDQLFGAAGSDDLAGGLGDDRLIAGPGGDDLYGGGGSDQLFGGEGSDTLTDGDRDGAQGGSAPGPDVLDGGAGAEDRISYGQRKTSVTVDLADTHPEGALGEGDRVSGIESIVGGRGDDRLGGDHGSNDLAGGSGSDQLRGRGGRDFLFAGNGGDSVWCGRGADEVLSPTAHAFLHRDCERVVYPAAPTMTAYPRTIAPDHITYRVPCFQRRPRCGRTVRLTEASGKGRLLARGTVTRGHVTRVVDVALTRLGRRLALREHGARATVRVTSDRWPRKLTWTIRLKLRS